MANVVNIVDEQRIDSYPSPGILCGVMAETLRLGIDVGSLTVKVVLLDGSDRVVEGVYRPSAGSPVGTVLQVLDEILPGCRQPVSGVAVSGSGGRHLSEALEAPYVNELVAQTTSVRRFYPQARTVIEIGGQDSKLLVLEEQAGRLELSDFSLNTQCAAGTGSFLEQQAGRLGLSTKEFSKLAAEAEDPPYIAGRCAVFAKSDIVHLQQVGTPLPQILGGLCMALARNFRSDVGRGKPFQPPILFQGGVSRNQGMVQAFRSVLHLSDQELIVPEHEVLMPAIGAALGCEGQGSFDWPAARRRLVTAMQTSEANSLQKFAPLEAPPSATMELPTRDAASQLYLGIDVGSVSTKGAVIDREGRLVAKAYLRTRGDPLRATREVLQALGQEVSADDVHGVGVTGSGRELVGRYVGADVVKNEITAQARAAVVIDPDVDTILEVGGQDSKFVRLQSGVVVDFSLNKACAAGTGSFLEEQAARLELPLEQMITSALQASQPVPLGERCTVFMESDLIHHQNRGTAKRDLSAGLAYSIALNYLNRVVGDRPIGERVFFQGGVAGNQAVVAAFATLLNKPVQVPPHFEVTGALGVALIAREVMG
ncbi:MAG: acyl-CoA dehydratase activase [Candidatus Bipolaricaulota bacterium]